MAVFNLENVAAIRWRASRAKKRMNFGQNGVLTNFERTNINQTYFEQTNFNWTDFEQTNFEQTNINLADINRSNLEQVSFQWTNINWITLIELSSNFKRTNFAVSFLKEHKHLYYNQIKNFTSQDCNFCLHLNICKTKLEMVWKKIEVQQKTRKRYFNRWLGSGRLLLRPCFWI
jgi:uncharacterized protein YjbI with pentapeptide repeats